MKESCRNSPCLVIVVPCYNEEQVLPLTAPLFLEELDFLISTRKISPDSKIMFVDDGSNDSTWEIIDFRKKKNNLRKKR